MNETGRTQVLPGLEQPIDIRRLRGQLAEHRISHVAFARQCGLSRAFIGAILSGRIQPGELARLKIAHAIDQFGLNREEGK